MLHIYHRNIKQNTSDNILLINYYNTKTFHTLIQVFRCVWLHIAMVLCWQVNLENGASLFLEFMCHKSYSLYFTMRIAVPHGTGQWWQWTVVNSIEIILINSSFNSVSMNISLTLCNKFWEIMSFMFTDPYSLHLKDLSW